MKSFYFIPCFLALFSFSCSSPKQAQSMINPMILNGSWEVTKMSLSTTPLNELYPEKKPTVTFDAANMKVSGNTGCNSFNGTYKANGSVIDLSQPMAMTRMMCPGEGEMTFVTTLQQVNGWTVRKESLRLMTGDLVVMHLLKISN